MWLVRTAELNHVTFTKEIALFYGIRFPIKVRILSLYPLHNANSGVWSCPFLAAVFPLIVT